MVLFGEVLDGDAAERCGLAWRCVDDDALLDEAMALAARAAAHRPSWAAGPRPPWAPAPPRPPPRRPRPPTKNTPPPTPVPPPPSPPAPQKSASGRPDGASLGGQVADPVPSRSRRSAHSSAVMA